MGEVFSSVKSVYSAVQGQGFYIELFYASVIFLAIRKKDKIEKRFFVYPTLLLVLIIFNPICAKIIAEKLIGWDTYWRIFWTLPMIATIAYAATKLVLIKKNISLRLVSIVMICIVIALCGKLMLNTELYDMPDNLYKLPDEVVEVGDLLLEDAGDDGYIKIAAPYAVACYIREYSGNIKQVYGRNAARGDAGKIALSMYGIISNLEPNVNELAELARNIDCNYLVIQSVWESDSEFAAVNFNYVGSTLNYDIYKDTTFQSE